MKTKKRSKILSLLLALSMLVGMVLFTGLNYLGQRFFAFREKKAE